MSRLALCLVIQEIGGHIDNALPGMGGPVDPGYGQGHPIMPGFGGGWGSGARPDQGLPGGGGHPSQGLPGSGAHPGNRPPGSWGGRPDQGLPGGGHASQLPSFPLHPSGQPPKPGVSPGAGLWVVAYVPGKGFEWVSITPGVPEKPQPKPPGGEIDNTLPTVPVDPAAPDQGLPPTPEPKK